MQNGISRLPIFSQETILWNQCKSEMIKNEILNMRQVDANWKPLGGFNVGYVIFKSSNNNNTWILYNCTPVLIPLPSYAIISV